MSGLFPANWATCIGWNPSSIIFEIKVPRAEYQVISSFIFSFSLTFLMSLFFARCSSCVPCQKFNRATFIPFLHICVRISSSSQAGAMVQIILVFRIFQNTFLYYNSKADTLCGGHTASDCLREIK